MNRRRTSRSRDSCWGTSLPKGKSPGISLSESTVGSESSRPRSSPSQKGGRGRNEPRSARRNHGSARSRKSSDEVRVQSSKDFRHAYAPRPPTTPEDGRHFQTPFCRRHLQWPSPRRRMPSSWAMPGSRSMQFPRRCSKRSRIRNGWSSGGETTSASMPRSRGVRSDPSESTTRGDDHDDRGPPEALLCVAALERGSMRRDNGGVRTLSERAGDRRACHPPLSRSGGGGLGCHVAAGTRLAEVLCRDAAAGIRRMSRSRVGGAEQSFKPFAVRGEKCVDARLADSKAQLDLGACPRHQESPRFLS